MVFLEKLNCMPFWAILGKYTKLLLSVDQFESAWYAINKGIMEWTHHKIHNNAWNKQTNVTYNWAVWASEQHYYFMCIVHMFSCITLAM